MKAFVRQQQGNILNNRADGMKCEAIYLVKAQNCNSSITKQYTFWNHKQA